MKKKKVGIFILIITIVGILLSYVMSYANTGETLHINLTRLDTTGIGYGIGDAGQISGGEQGPVSSAVIWNITTHDANGNISATQRNLYCVKANYGATWETAGGPNTVLDYNLSYDLQKDRTELLNKIVDNGTDIDDAVKTLLSESGYYRELLWILDNSYIPGTTDKKEFLKSIGIEYDSDLQAYVYNPISGYDYSSHISGNSMMFGYSESHLMTDSDIKAVQRAAIWYYTNYMQDKTYYTAFNNKEKIDWLTITKDGNSYQQLADYNKTTGEGTERFEQAQILYNYLIDAASKNKEMYTSSNNYTVNGGVKVNTDGLSSSAEGKYKLTTTRVGNNYVVGPIKIDKNGTVPYGVIIEVTDQNGNKLNYTYTDQNGNPLGTTDIKTLVGRTGGFYITVARENVEKVKVKIEVTQTTTKKTLWLKGKESTDKITLEREQPIVEVTRKEEKVPTEFEGQPEEFDLALRKYITQVNGTNVTNTRVPNIDLSTLQSGTTATYKHRKDPVVVNENDEVTYTLAIYNEGNKAGYASEIVDQLPTGLVMSSSTTSTVVSKDKNGNTKNTYTVKYEASTNKITFTINANNVKSLVAYKTGTLDYETIEIKCKVVQTPDTQNQIILTNVAWISGAYDSESKTLITTKGQDRDSEPQTKPNVNKDNMQNYKGNETNKDDLTDKDYFYKGEQDDDDFEKLVLMPEINIPVTKIWNDNNNQDGKRATSVTIKLLADGVDTGKTLVLNEENNWKGTFTGLAKKANGVDIVYTIKEEPVPSGYTVAITGDVTGFTVTNTYTPETINIPVTKIWNDNNNQDGKRATSVTIKLLADGVDTGKTLVLNEANNWKGTFTGLAKKANGVDIVYTIKEEPVPSGYTVAITGDVTGFTITNTYTPETINIPVTKIWNDNNNQDGKRATSVTIKLLADGVDTGKTLVLNEANNWKGTFTGLAKKANGVDIVYTIKEEPVPSGYTVAITGDVTGFTITNTYTPETINIPVTKIWNDNNNQDGKRATSVTIKLLADGVDTGKTLVLNEANNWKGTFTGLAKKANGVDIVYTIKEEPVPSGYTVAITGDVTGFTVTNTYTPETINIPVTKIWNDNNNQDGKRATSVTIKLLADGVDTGKTLVLNEENNWKGTFTGLAKKANGVDIVYTIKEEPVPSGYTVAITGDVTGFTVTNTYTPETINIPVTKIWNDNNNQDGKRATSVTIKLLADGVDTGKTLVLNEGNNWKGTFTGLAKKANGVDIVYTIKEEPVPSGYTVAITGDVTGFTVTNTYTPETINIPVTKIWNDNNNQDGKRATSVTIKLLADGVDTRKTLVLNEANNWKGTFTGLAKKANGVDIVYTIKEEPVPSGYTVAITGDITGLTVTNTYAPEKINIPVTKIWQDNGDADKIRPESITVNLKKGTEVIDTVELNKENNWTHIFENLPKKENGEEIIYTVEEIQPEGYTASITGSMAEGFVITNKHEVSKKIFDLALRKYITKINDKDITTLGLNSRVPKIDLSTLQSGTTATYKHRKDPIAVEEGDIVTYQLTIYNEGEKAGYASQIVDQLPEGLIYVPNGEIVSKDADGNAKNKYIAKYESSINKITFEIVEDQEIKDLEPYSEGNLDRETLEIKCKVVYRDNTEKKHILTNVAWINEEYNTTDNVKIEKVGDDRDSEPQTKPNVNKDNMENYKGDEANKDNLSDDEYYYKGEQDDDDFEKLYVKTFDLALRKFIMTVNGNKLTASREPVVDITPLKEGTGTTAIYKHSKVPVALEVGDTVVYTIRVYNEGEIAGTASEVKDYLPPYLIYVEDSEINKKYAWEISEDGRIATTKYLANTEIKEFNGEKLDYVDVQIECKVANNSIPHENITNIAEISEYTYNETVVPEDRDSKSDNIKENIPEDKDLPDYKKDKEKDDYVPGNEDDDDFEKVYVKELDLALRKFITLVNDEKPETSRVPVVDVTPLKNGTGTTAIYNHTKEPLSLKAGDNVVYTIRIYNEGEVAGTASEIKDYLPPYLIYLEDSEINKKYGWKISEDGRVVTTDYLSNTEIKEFDGEKLDYADVQIECKVAGNAIPHENITNIAEISEYKYEETVVPKDRDSKSDNMEENIPEDKDLPDYKKDKEKDQYVPGNEDDDDFEKVYVKEFDLALRKFITEVQEKSITDRVPQPKLEDGKITYEHTKEPLTVHVGDTVIYTLRIYNEGEIDGYASEVSDDIPEYLEYLPKESTNIEYMWKMYDENGEETTDVSKAVKLTTTYLSKENSEQNLLKAFDGKTLEGRDIKIAFKVKDPNSNSIIITNKAQISDDTDKDGKDITDKDSTPDEWNEGEDDQDVEHVKVEYFDLALLKFVSKVIVIEDGKETISETGYNGHEDPEPVVKVDLHKKKLSDVTVKFGYGITIINEGDIPGYAKEITDYIPEGLRFEAEDNPLWTDEGNNIISTKQLENTLLQPGETATVEVILTWINDPNNMGLKTNTAEISQDKNEYDVPDRDSTLDNKKEGEDDIDIAKVILSITTGASKTYFILATSLLAIIGTGIVLIKKYVIE